MRNDKNATLTFNAVVNELQSQLSASARIADVGCDDGQLLSILHRNGYHQLVGIGYEIKVENDIAAMTGIDLNQENWSSQIANGKFDCLIATDVIEHLTNPYGFLVELRKLLNDNGKLILTFPNVHNLRSIIAYATKGRFTGFFGRNFNDGHPLFDQHIWVPNIHLLKYFFKLTGFELQSIQYINGPRKLFSQTTMVVAQCSPTGASTVLQQVTSDSR